jgi:hypothetical protein
MIAQVVGFIGMLLVPIGVLWLIQELRKIKGNSEPSNNWRNGYYFAITATILCTIFGLFFALGFLMNLGPVSAIAVLLLTGLGIAKAAHSIRKLRKETTVRFHAAPLYLLSIPIIAFSVRFFFIGPVSDFSRNYAIEKGQHLVGIIEEYYARHNRYPHSIEELAFVPKPSIMGIDKFQYELFGDTYNLWFEQYLEVGATREVVMYNKNNEHNVKGHYASFNAKQPSWRYYWLD